jgi:hypothetical protein
MEAVSPVFIYTIARSGSSLVTGIFGAHGLYVGPVEKKNPFGYCTNEHLTIREAVNNISRADPKTRMKSFHHSAGKRHARDIFLRDMPRDKRWVYKSGVTHFPLFDGLFDDMKHIFVLRNRQSVIESNLAKGHGNRESTEYIVNSLSDYTEELGRTYPIVHTDEVIAGNYSTLEWAFNYCDIEFQPEIADKLIDPNKWRF